MQSLLLFLGMLLFVLVFKRLQVGDTLTNQSLNLLWICRFWFSCRLVHIVKK